MSPLLWALCVSPLFLGLARAGALSSPRRRLFAAAAVALVLMMALPWQGLPLDDVKRGQFLVASAFALLLAARRAGLAALTPERERAALVALALAAGLIGLNFFQFHGLRTWVHGHDVAHYYLGGRYFGELGYQHLYVAILHAEGELGGEPVAPQARDLRTNVVVPAAELRQAGAAARAQFSAERWFEFRRDVRMLRDKLGPNYAAVLVDHGFNPTPVWALIGGSLASLVEPGSLVGLRALTLIDPLLLAVALAAAWRAFGARAAALAAIHLALVFGAGFAWTGGAFLRHLWFASCVLGLCALRRERPATAGACFALAAGLRVFPAAFVVGAAARWSWARFRGERDTSSARLLVAFALTLGALGLATTAGPRGLAAWDDFRVNMSRHVEAPASNLVGIAAPIVDLIGPEPALRGERHAQAQRAQRLLLFPPVLVAMCWLARGRDPVAAALLALPLCLAGLNLASYYWALLALLSLRHAQSPGRLLALASLEVASYGLFVLGVEESALFAARSLLLCALLAALEWPSRAGPAPA